MYPSWLLFREVKAPESWNINMRLLYIVNYNLNYMSVLFWTFKFYFIVHINLVNQMSYHNFQNKFFSSIFLVTFEVDTSSKNFFGKESGKFEANIYISDIYISIFHWRRTPDVPIQISSILTGRLWKLLNWKKKRLNWQRKVIVTKLWPPLSLVTSLRNNSRKNLHSTLNLENLIYGC